MRCAVSLMQSFKDIKRVFQEVFVELFGGGEARLELTDDDVLESGIRIIAQLQERNFRI